MAKQILKKPAVWQDLLEQVDFISQRSPDAAERFVDAVEATFGFLADHPLLGGLCSFNHPEADGLRRWPIRGFKHHVAFYRPLSNGIEVVRLLHSARDAAAEIGDPIT
ncbi:MAG TPA: type II toxin-antitoxin system RelE/ParE family toxin [Pirellulales bacterium]|jgi:toxin ParE1/3/4|nr:type II toxin-antitoxin system RelE/ParE family toxin [Pirellulales bacterium]